MTAQFQFFQSLPHKKADFVKKKPAELGVIYFLFFSFWVQYLTVLLALDLKTACEDGGVLRAYVVSTKVALATVRHHQWSRLKPRANATH